MAWIGYYEFGGSELVNVARTERYAKNARLPWFKPVYDGADYEPTLSVLEGYRTPLLDDAPWLDSNRPESMDFLGFYPSAIDGLEDSTRTSQVVEYVNDGGSPGRLRHGTRQIAFRGLLIATSEAGADFGMTWLRQVLLGNMSDWLGDATQSHWGTDLCYYASPPEVDWEAEGESLEDCLSPLRRSMRRVSVNAGPTVVSKHGFSDGTCFWEVSFTARAGIPWEFGDVVKVVEGFRDSTVADPYVAPYDGDIDTDGFVFDEPDCSGREWTPIYDPADPEFLAPPTPPDLIPTGFEPPANWVRRYLTIPSDVVPLWGEVVPVIAIHTGAQEVRKLRLRFYPDPYKDSAGIGEDPCSFIGDIMVKYIPPNSTMILDGASERITIRDYAGRTRDASSLAMTSSKSPVEWPSLTCDIQYVMAADEPQSPVLNYKMDVSLVNRTR